MVSISDAREQFESDGFVVLPSYLSREELAAGLVELPALFPTADEFHDDLDPARNARFRDEFAGIDNFPFAGMQLGLLAVHPRLIGLAQHLLGTDEVRVYSIQAWAKYTAATSYDQAFHRDYLSQSLVVRAPHLPACDVSMFLFLCDVPVELGPPAFVPRAVEWDLPALPNWYPPVDRVIDEDEPTWTSQSGSPHLYEAEVSAAGPAGTVAAYRSETFHRGTELTVPRGARYTIHVSFRRADSDWISRRAWREVHNDPRWREFVAHALPEQLRAFGFPPPRHPYWTDTTLRGMTQRYPGFNPAPWRPSY